MFFPGCQDVFSRLFFPYHIILKVAMFLLIVVTTLCENGLPKECHLCDEGYYTVRNCSRTETGGLSSTQCKPCSSCGEGQRILVNCTMWSNTVCGSECGYTQQNSKNICQKVMTTSASTVMSATATTVSTPTGGIWMLAAFCFLVVISIALALALRFGACVPFQPGMKLPENSTKHGIV